MERGQNFFAPYLHDIPDKKDNKTQSTAAPPTTTPKEIDKHELITKTKDILTNGQKFVDQYRYNSDERLIILYLAEMAEIEILLSKIQMTSKQERLKDYKQELMIYEETMKDLERQILLTTPTTPKPTTPKPPPPNSDSM